MEDAVATIFAGYSLSGNREAPQGASTALSKERSPVVGLQVFDDPTSSAAWTREGPRDTNPFPFATYSSSAAANARETLVAVTKVTSVPGMGNRRRGGKFLLRQRRCPVPPYPFKGVRDTLERICWDRTERRPDGGSPRLSIVSSFTRPGIRSLHVRGRVRRRTS